MPVPYLRRLIGKERSQKANRQLARVLAFIAGAIDAGVSRAIGFVHVGFVVTLPLALILLLLAAVPVMDNLREIL